MFDSGIYMKKEVVKKSFITSLPVMAGYLFLGAGFGVILSGEGYGIFWALLMSITMLSGDTSRKITHRFLKEERGKDYTLAYWDSQEMRFVNLAFEPFL